MEICPELQRTPAWAAYLPGRRVRMLTLLPSLHFISVDSTPATHEDNRNPPQPTTHQPPGTIGIPPTVSLHANRNDTEPGFWAVWWAKPFLWPQAGHTLAREEDGALHPLPGGGGRRVPRHCAAAAPRRGQRDGDVGDAARRPWGGGTLTVQFIVQPPRRAAVMNGDQRQGLRAGPKRVPLPLGGGS